MQKFLGFGVVFFTVIACLSGAEAIDVYFAEVKNGGAFVQGDKAAAYSTITWEGQSIASANRFGGFRFLGVVPKSCIGTLSDGTSTIQVVVVDCTPGIIPTAIVSNRFEMGTVRVSHQMQIELFRSLIRKGTNRDTNSLPIDELMQ